MTSLAEVSHATASLYADYIEYLELLASLSIFECPTLVDFAAWRKEELLAQGETPRVNPPIH